VVRISCDKLGDCETAAQMLEEALERDWTPKRPLS
jgi:hypothetical protein